MAASEVTDRKLADIEVIARRGEPADIAEGALREALDHAYAVYEPTEGERLPPADAFGLRDSSNMGGEVLFGVFVKALVAGAGGAVAKKTVDAIWDLAMAFLRDKRERDVAVSGAKESPDGKS